MVLIYTYFVTEVCPRLEGLKLSAFSFKLADSVPVTEVCPRLEGLKRLTECMTLIMLVAKLLRYALG